MQEAFDTALTAVDASHFNQPMEKGEHFLLLPKGELIDRVRVR